MPDNLPLRFWQKVRFLENGCWEWKAALDAYGYGALRVSGKTVKAHRLSHAAFRGATERDLDHLCRNRACVNPDHLEPISRGENVRRSPLVGRSPNSRRDRNPVTGRFVGNG